MHLAPTEPRNVQAIQSGDHSVKVSWEPPTHANGKLKKYVANCCVVKGCLSANFVQSESSESTSAEVTGIYETEAIECWVEASVERTSDMPMIGGPKLSTISAKTQPFTMKPPKRKSFRDNVILFASGTLESEC